MSEHTPGPWKAIKVSGTWVIVDWGDERQRRRTNETIGGVYKRTHGTEEEHTANAHLIAAAPDLLAACKEIREECGHIYSHSHSCWVCMVKDAIKKAEGETL